MMCILVVSLAVRTWDASCLQARRLEVIIEHALERRLMQTESSLQQIYRRIRVETKVSPMLNEHAILQVLPVST